MPTYHNRQLKPCKNCGVRPVLEHWTSGGYMFAVRCDNPDRPDDCNHGFYQSMSRNPEEAIKKWNEWCERSEEDK